jgi:hypothetical protein
VVRAPGERREAAATTQELQHDDFPSTRARWLGAGGSRTCGGAAAAWRRPSTPPDPEEVGRRRHFPVVLQDAAAGAPVPKNSCRRRSRFFEGTGAGGLMREGTAGLDTRRPRVGARTRRCRSPCGSPGSAGGPTPVHPGSASFAPVQSPNPLGFAGSLRFSTPERRFWQGQVAARQGTCPAALGAPPTLSSL